MAAEKLITVSHRDVCQVLPPAAKASTALQPTSCSGAGESDFLFLFSVSVWDFTSHFFSGSLLCLNAFSYGYEIVLFVVLDQKTFSADTSF